MVGTFWKVGFVSAMPPMTARRSFSSSSSPISMGRFGPVGSAGLIGCARRERAPRVSMMMASGLRRTLTSPFTIRAGTPIKLASSTPTTSQICREPLGSLATKRPLKSGTAQSTPSTLRTRCKAVTCIGLVSSTNCRVGSVTQRSACGVSSMSAYVRLMSPTKMLACCAINNVAKASPSRIP